MPKDRDTIRARLKDPERRVELIATFLMSVAIVGSAYCAWQATRWGGVQAVAFAEASSLRVESSKALTLATQQTVYDATTLVQLLVSYSEGETQSAVDFAERFTRAEFKVYVDEWLEYEPLKNPDAPANPFALESYSNAEMERVDDLEDQAAAKFEEAKAANQTGDDYILATVFFAIVLFFSGIAPKLAQRPLQWTVLLFALAGLGLGFWRILSLPFY